MKNNFMAVMLLNTVLFAGYQLLKQRQQSCDTFYQMILGQSNIKFVTVLKTMSGCKSPYKARRSLIQCICIYISAVINTFKSKEKTIYIHELVFVTLFYLCPILTHLKVYIDIQLTYTFFLPWRVNMVQFSQTL